MISGVVLMVWGAAILVSAAVRDADSSGAYATGQKAASLFAPVLVGLGVSAFVKGRQARRAQSGASR